MEIQRTWLAPIAWRVGPGGAGASAERRWLNSPLELARCGSPKRHRESTRSAARAVRRLGRHRRWRNKHSRRMGGAHRRPVSRRHRRAGPFFACTHSPNTFRHTAIALPATARRWVRLGPAGRRVRKYAPQWDRGASGELGRTQHSGTVPKHGIYLLRLEAGEMRAIASSRSAVSTQTKGSRMSTFFWRAAATSSRPGPGRHAWSPTITAPLGNAISYQGKPTERRAVTAWQFHFSLFDAWWGGTQPASK